MHELPDDLASALQSFASIDTVVIALDFDGVMAPIVNKPELSAPLPENAAALAQLATLPKITTALVSGRSMESLQQVSQAPENTVLYASHGAQSQWGSQSELETMSLDQEQNRALDQASQILETLSVGFPGVHIEPKPVGVVLHTRESETEVGDAAVQRALQVLSDIPGAHVSLGKKVVEVAVVKADKGQAIRDLKQRTGSEAVLFIGDDVTDENAFAVLNPDTGDVGIKVGPGQSAAQFRIDGPEQLSLVLNSVARLRQTVEY